MSNWAYTTGLITNSADVADGYQWSVGDDTRVGTNTDLIPSADPPAPGEFWYGTFGGTIPAPGETGENILSLQDVLDAVTAILGIVKNKPLKIDCDNDDRLQMMRGDDYTDDRVKTFPLNVVMQPPAGSTAVFTVRGLYCDTLLLEAETQTFQAFDGEYSAVFELPKFMELEKPGIHKFDVEYRPSGGRVETVAWGEINLIEDQTRPEAT